MKPIARVSDDFMMDGVRIYVGYEYGPQNRDLYRFTASGHGVREHMEPLATVEPSLIIPNDVAIQLLNALAKHFQGYADTLTAREDLLAERARSSKLTDAVIFIATGRPERDDLAALRSKPPRSGP